MGQDLGWKVMGSNPTRHVSLSPMCPQMDSSKT